MGNLRKFGILVVAEDWELSELNHQRTWVKIMYGLLTGALSKPSCCEEFTQTHPQTNRQGTKEGREGGREEESGREERERKREKSGGGKGRRKEEEKESAFSSWLCSNASVHLNNHSLFWTLSFPIRKMGRFRLNYLPALILPESEFYVRVPCGPRRWRGPLPDCGGNIPSLQLVGLAPGQGAEPGLLAVSETLPGVLVLGGLGCCKKQPRPFCG